jgi:hypothetical protein
LGDEIYLEDGSLVTIVTIDSKVDEDQRLYNFNLDGDKTYYANGYLTHNK